MRTTMLVLACLALPACGGDDENPSPEDYPECTEEGVLVLEGTLAGQEVNLQKQSQGYVFGNCCFSTGEPGSMELRLDARQEVRVRLEFEKTLVRGGTVEARGLVHLPDDGITAGNCETESLTGKLLQSSDGETYSFVLRDLRAQPYCGGAERKGELRGCYREISR
ncbi:hypothetical protein [Pyxidicoccus trucidator]|uniref:hypothetical protein n=1 Tax=Pyxidicoccus trucidator TaxID=2709662 RepID=UPI0013D9C7A1|nr:hypothetical protein [Pyxidicoccus trucidator]